MKINLTKKQYETLAKAVYLGNWMANAQRTGQEGDERIEEYEEIADYILSLAPEFGLSENYEHELECGDHGGITEVNRFHEEYDENNLWEELPEALGERDFYRMYSENQRGQMTNEEHFEKLMYCTIAWEKELYEHGVDRLVIMKMPKDL